MKSFISITSSLLAAALISLGCSEGDRDKVLKVYNWSCYIDEALIEEFEQWYEEQTGEPISVIYQTFDINETMLSKIEKGHEDFDCVCPSDYIIERMLKADLLLEIPHDFGDTPDYISTNLSPFVKKNLRLLDSPGKDPVKYAVGYMWGTTGILYNSRYVLDEEASTWGVLANPKFKDKIFVKDAARDVYSQILIYLRQKELQEGKVTLDSLMYDSSDSSLLDVKNYMCRVRELVAGWEADFGKEQMTQEKGWINLTWSGDAVWAIEEAAMVDVPLSYVVPKEGATVWFDGWVIPKYAKNVKAASYWINFLCTSDAAIRNMDEIGYVSAIGTQEVLEAVRDSTLEAEGQFVDLSYFFDADNTCEPVDGIQYPDISVINRCTLEHDWGDKTKKLLEMWAQVKGNQMSWWTICVICLAGVAIVAYIFNKYFLRAALRKARRRRLDELKKASSHKKS